MGIAGHRTTNGAPFRDIDKLEPGDEIRVEMPYGTFIYEVERHQDRRRPRPVGEGQGGLQPPDPVRLPSALQRGAADRGVRALRAPPGRDRQEDLTGAAKPFLAVAAVVAVVAAVGASGQAGGCSEVADPGADLREFVNGLQPGDVGCLHAGSYGARGDRVVWEVDGSPSRRITLRGYPGEARPTILAPFTLDGDHLTVAGILFDGPSGRALTDDAIAFWIEGDHDELLGSEIRDAESQGIYLDGADDVRLVGNYIHDNGDKDDPDVANLHHGIYFASGSGLVAGNVIVDNYSYGVHLYPSPHGVTVEQNVIAGHGRGGVIIGAEPGERPPRDNRVRDNVVASNAHRPVTSHGPIGSGNVVSRNVFWRNGGDGDTVGLALFGNVARDPRSGGLRWLSVLAPFAARAGGA